MTTTAQTTYRVGELARVAGVTVRALHHYDGLGLLSPSERTSGGHRLYTAPDVERLYPAAGAARARAASGGDRRPARR